MNALILNRESFSLPEDGWYHMAPLGVFPHAGSGVVQVVDAEACNAMASAFAEETAKEHFAGLLIDFDHFSLNTSSSSEAAGWIVALEAREAGLWAQIRWSDVSAGLKVA
ncbi:MAG: phage protease [Kiritimatiellae bacterium]|nr:phage protease [Kiritimatiellia bacterium]